MSYEMGNIASVHVNSLISPCSVISEHVHSTIVRGLTCTNVGAVSYVLSVGLAKTVNIHCIRPYIWFFAKNPVWLWFWPILVVCLSRTQRHACVQRW